MGFQIHHGLLILQLFLVSAEWCDVVLQEMRRIIFYLAILK